MSIPVFCDWMKCRFQVNKPPIGTNYQIQQFNRDIGVSSPDWERNAWVQHVKKPETLDEYMGTSASSSVQLRFNPDSNYLDIDGNLGRWGRGDAVWNYGVYSAAWRFLPSILNHGVEIRGDIELKRIDLTANVAFKSATDAYAYLRWAGMHKIHRLNPVHYLTGVMWKTENYSLKIYDKIADLKRVKNKLLSEKLNSEVGYILRFELTLRTDELKKFGMSKLTDWQHRGDMMSVIFSEKFKPLLKNEVNIDIETADMPARLASAVDSWRSGRSYPAMLSDGRISRATYYRLRRDLLAYGFDISQPADVTALNIKPREIEFSFVSAPEWYWKNTG
jgi:II/X family phage/plasmid replication protein